MVELLPGLNALAPPRFFRVQQHFDSPSLPDPAAVLRDALIQPAIAASLIPGQTAALAIGSRGLAQLPLLVRTLVEALRTRGLNVFIVPAMGSHGGATPEGQREVLASLGVTAASVGCPVRSSMDVVELGTFSSGTTAIPLYMDRLAHTEADIVIPLVRIKPHTSFHGPYESGICKMLAVGLSKHVGCARLHREGFAAFPELIPAAAREILKSKKIPFALALLENAREQPALLEAIPSAQILAREPGLLQQARAWMPRLLPPRVDVLLIDEIGKDVSGTGMDPNITGRSAFGPVPGCVGPQLARIGVLSLTAATHGNATGLGLADFTTQVVLDALDRHATYTNCLTSGNLAAGKIPVVLPDGETVLRATLLTVPGVPADQVRVVRIKNTLHLEEIAVSENLCSELAHVPGCTVTEEFDGRWKPARIGG